MPRICTICAHPEREEIDKALLDARSGYRAKAKRFGVSESSLYRHRTKHLPEVVARGLALTNEERVDAAKSTPPEDAHAAAVATRSMEVREQEDAHVIDVTQQLRAINVASLEVLRKARAEGKLGVLLQATDRIARQIELQAKLLGQISDGQTVNIAVLPEWQLVRTKVLQALDRYPEARIAVAKALTEGDLP